MAMEELTDDDVALHAAKEHKGSDKISVKEDDTLLASSNTSAGCIGPAAPLVRRHKDGEDGLKIAATAEKAVLQLREVHQRSITNFFAPSK